MRIKDYLCLIVKEFLIKSMKTYIAYLEDGLKIGHIEELPNGAKLEILEFCNEWYMQILYKLCIIPCAYKVKILNLKK